MKRLLWLALITVLLIKFTLVLPTPTALTLSATNESNEIDTSTSPRPKAAAKSGNTGTNNRKRITVMVFKKYTNLLSFQLARTHQIAKDLLSDPTIMAVENEEMQDATNMLLDYVAQSDISELAKLPPAEIPNRYYLAIGTIFVIGKFDSFVRQLSTTSTSEQNRTHTEQLLWSALQRHGLQEYQVELQQRYTELFEKIVDEVEEYVKILSPADREKDKELVQAYDMYAQHPERFTKVDFGSSLFDAFFKEAAKAYE